MYESCVKCGGFIDPFHGFYCKTPDERFSHVICEEEGPPSEPVYSQNVKEMYCFNIQYQCGHYAYGVPRLLPQACPDCGEPIP